jgi:hypothetical protein
MAELENSHSETLPESFDALLASHVHHFAEEADESLVEVQPPEPY